MQFTLIVMALWIMTKNNSGGIGYIAGFPDSVDLKEISISKVQYQGGNIETIDFEALVV